MARPFVFRFETMLRIRRQTEDEHKRIVADRMGQIEQVRQELARLEEQIQSQLAAIRHGQEPGTIDMQQVVRHRQWLGRLHKTVLDSQSRLRYLEAQLARERAALAEAAKQRRILEKLKERQHANYVKEMAKRELKADDELATLRYTFDQRSVAAQGVASEVG